jgi:small-conductance mechanosensitive channel
MFDVSLEKIAPKLVEMGIAGAKGALQIVLLLVAAYVTLKIVRVALSRLETLLVRAGQASETVPGATQQRVRTLMSVISTITVGLIWFLVVLIGLGQVGINIGPILAGAGVIGLAVGFGAQNLVRDLVSGFFLILENQIRVGDIAVVNGTPGLVEAITFRTVILRDLAAVVHIFPNGAINTISNMTKDWSAYVIDAGVAYKEDTDHVVEVMRRVADEMQAENDYGSLMLGSIEIFGVDNFADSAVVIKARLKTRPLQQFTVGREYRRRLKKAFDAEGIEIPFPHRTLYMGEASQPFELLTKEAPQNA